jgi:hypothetical protein
MPVVADEPKFAELVHESTGAGSGGTNHLSQGFSRTASDRADGSKSGTNAKANDRRAGPPHAKNQSD